MFTWKTRSNIGTKVFFVIIFVIIKAYRHSFSFLPLFNFKTISDNPLYAIIEGHIILDIVLIISIVLIFSYLLI
jgi:hypothetical protein